MIEMKRREFLKTVVSIAAAAVVAPRIEAAPTLIKAPRGLPFVINEGTAVYPELSAPVTNLNLGALSRADFDRVKKKLKAISKKNAGRPLYVQYSPAQREAINRLTGGQHS